jgi:hypothetical protein
LAFSAEIKNYAIYCLSRSPDKMEALIRCYDSGPKLVGEVEFYSDPAKLGPNKINSGYVTIKFPLSRFDSIVNVLQYEKRLWVGVTDQLMGYIQNMDLEPAGEQELGP